MNLNVISNRLKQFCRDETEQQNVLKCNVRTEYWKRPFNGLCPGQPG